MSQAHAPRPDRDTIRDVVRGFLLDNLLMGYQALDVDRIESFIDARAIDSTGFLELVAFVQERFEIHVNDDEIVPANFDSLEKIASYVDTKLAR